jgi:hypothetical protein
MKSLDCVTLDKCKTNEFLNRTICYDCLFVQYEMGQLYLSVTLLVRAH